MSLKSLFSTAARYAAYYKDVISVIPSEGVKDILKEKGWRFTEAPEAAALLEAPLIPYAYGCVLPLEIVSTESGTDVYKNGGVDIIHWYEEDKKTAARIKHGIGTP